MTEFLCSYCGQKKPKSERTDEHVIPQKVGGGVSPVNPFKIKPVCKRYNGTCGFFVDGPFVMNSLVNSHHALRIMEFVDLEKGDIAPLNYLGHWQEESIKPTGLDCEMWLDPTGDSVLHYHKPYPEVPGTLGMVSPKALKDIDPGYVIVFIATNNPIWQPTVINSILAHIGKKTSIYFANVGSTDNQFPKNTFNLIRKEKI